MSENKKLLKNRNDADTSQKVRSEYERTLTGQILANVSVKLNNDSKEL